jgi:hypothetical protein
MMIIIINTCWEATQRVMAAKFTRMTHKIAIQLHLMAESCTICSSRSMRPVRKLLDTPSYLTMKVELPLCQTKHHAMKTCWGSGSIGPRIPNFGTRWNWVVSFMRRPLYPRDKSLRYLLVWTRWRREISHHCPRRELSPDRPARSLVSTLTELPGSLSYTSPCKYAYWQKKVSLNKIQNGRRKKRRMTTFWPRSGSEVDGTAL